MSKFFDDVVYEVWRRGGNPDAVERDDPQLREAELCGDDPDDVAGAEIERQQRRRDDGGGEW